MMIDLTPEQIYQWRNETILSGGCWIGILHPGEGGLFPERHWLPLRNIVDDTMNFENATFRAPDTAEYQGLAFFLNKSDDRPIFSFPFDEGTHLVTMGSDFTVQSVRLRLDGGRA